jgi:hypothetical protein
MKTQISFPLTKRIQYDTCHLQMYRGYTAANNKIIRNYRLIRVAIK